MRKRTPQIAQIMRITMSTIVENVSKYPAILSQVFPAMRPRTTRTVFQIIVPADVKTMNGANDIFVEPAGREIRLLTMGMQRQMNTALLPHFRNHFFAFSTSSGFRCKIRPVLPLKIFSSRSVLISLPTRYSMIAPATDPNVAIRITTGTFIDVDIVINPPKVRIISEGIGGKIFSRVISKNTAR